MSHLDSRPERVDCKLCRSEMISTRVETDSSKIRFHYKCPECRSAGFVCVPHRGSMDSLTGAPPTFYGKATPPVRQ